MIVMLHNNLCEDGAPETTAGSGGAVRQDGEASESAGTDLRDADGLFYLVADGTATTAQRLLFSNKLLRSEELYRRVSNTQMMWASLSSPIALARASRLEHNIKLCDRRRGETQNDAAMLERPSVTGGVSEGGPSRVIASRRSPLKPVHLSGSSQKGTVQGVSLRRVSLKRVILEGQSLG